jgi:thiamine biosynthesis lipoprotein
MTASLTRRRLIGITAAAAGLALLPLGTRARADARLITWRGQAMGAFASLQIHHHDQAAAGSLIERAIAEVRRLEGIFSLYRDDSALVALNRRGVLVAPPPELVDLLAASRRYHALTAGAFDPTVQALWTLYREHFSTPGADPDGPPAALREAALSLVGFNAVAFDQNRVALPRRGMALTFNGIAQGYATDRILEILRSGGVTSSLVDMGEPRALGPSAAGTPWRVGIASPDEPARVSEVVELVDRAVATSGAYGFRFDREGRFNHLLDPRTGRSAELHRSVTVLHQSATEADALSTAFSFMTENEIASVLVQLGEGEVRLRTPSGESRSLRA